MDKYAGSEWLKRSLKYSKAGDEVSPLGESVADLLGELFAGLYHLDQKCLDKVDWKNNHHIEITIGWKDWSTTDFNNLTRLVFLCHWRAIRVSMFPSTHGYMRLLFHQRKRSGDVSERHPTIDQAIELFMEFVSLPEYKETHEQTDY